MYYPIGPGSLFRVASDTSGNVWPDPVLGHGAYYVGINGNRYSRPDQLTVYCAEDPLVAITEGAYYQALKWQNDIAFYRMKGVNYPLRSAALALGVSDVAPTTGNRSGKPTFKQSFCLFTARPAESEPGV